LPPISPAGNLRVAPVVDDNPDRDDGSRERGISIAALNKACEILDVPKPMPPGCMHRRSPSAWSRLALGRAGVGLDGSAMIFGLWA